MKVLAMDTSQAFCSVAIVEDGKTLKEMHSTEEKEHSQTLMPMVKQLLESQNLTLDDIKLLACSRGPGSFTGIRIGMATTKAFSDAKNIPIVGVNSLEALAYATIMQKGNKDSKILTIIDAKNDNVYFAVYKIHNGNVTVFKNPGVMDITKTVEYVNFQEPLYIMGDVSKDRIEPLLVAKKSKEQAQGKTVSTHEYIDLNVTMAEAIGLGAISKFKLGKFGYSGSITPMYLRKPQAQRQKEGDDDELTILEMTNVDFENIKENYENYKSSWNLQTFEEDYKNSKYFVAKQNNNVIGYIGIKSIFDEIDVMNIVIREDKRGQGIASNLLSYVIRKNENKKIHLEVNENNISAIKLYQKFGFRVEGMRKKYYNQKEDAILMSLN